MNELESVKQEIQAAELVLVGIGKEFEEKFQWEQIKEPYRKYFRDLQGKEEGKRLLPYIKSAYCKENGNEAVKRAYGNLKECIENKNYFIVSTCKDGYIRKAGFKTDRVVLPCGTYEYLQCGGKEPCNAAIKDAREAVAYVMNQIQISDKENHGKIDWEQIALPKCDICGSDLEFNTVLAAHYEEKGYLEDWNIYTKWLQGTVNKRLCILELGVGMEFPTVIRWPFEKVAFYNNKSKLYRIHEKLYQVPNELAEKGISIHENSLSFLG